MTATLTQLVSRSLTSPRLRPTMFPPDAFKRSRWVSEEIIATANRLGITEQWSVTQHEFEPEHELLTAEY